MASGQQNIALVVLHGTGEDRQRAVREASGGLVHGSPNLGRRRGAEGAHLDETFGEAALHDMRQRARGQEIVDEDAVGLVPGVECAREIAFRCE